jgi:hypothetical protein
MEYERGPRPIAPKPSSFHQWFQLSESLDVHAGGPILFLQQFDIIPSSFRKCVPEADGFLVGCPT